MSNAFTTIQTFGTIRTYSMSVKFLHLSQCVVCGADILYTQKDFKPCLAPATRRICYFFFCIPVIYSLLQCWSSQPTWRQSPGIDSVGSIVCRGCSAPGRHCRVSIDTRQTIWRTDGGCQGIWRRGCRPGCISREILRLVQVILLLLVFRSVCLPGYWTGY